MKLPDLSTHEWNEDSLAEMLGHAPTARAVKALPDLLEALEFTLEILPQWGDGVVAYDKARAALIKAGASD